MNIRDLRASVCASISLCLLTAASAHAASFDCAKARTQVEHLICDTPQISQLDERLAATYKTTLVGDPSARERQTAWLRETRNRCEDAACLTSAYQAQLAAMGSAAPIASAVPPSSPATAGPASPQWACPIDWSALADIDGPDSERVILRIKARDWRKEHLDMLLRRQQECQRGAGEPESLRTAIWNEVRTKSYPGAVAAIERRDQRQQQAEAIAKQAESSNASSASLPSQAAAPAPVQQAAPPRTTTEPEKPIVQEAASEDSYQAKQRRQVQLTVAGAVLLAVVAAWVWHKFIRNRCPKCKSTNIDTTDVSEVDRWRGSKKVTEQHSRGSRTRHVSATYVKNVYSYRCRDCQTEWTAQKKEEL